MDIRTRVKSSYGDWIEKYGPAWREQLGALKDAFGSRIESTLFPGEYPTDVPIVFVDRAAIVEVLQFLKTHTGFEYCFLSDITATDESPTEPRFVLVYNLFSLYKGPRIRIKVRVPENETVASVVSVWPGANWAEREVFDMFGIQFSGHPDLRRILMDERWVGHPLRKDYPLRGYQIFSTAQNVNEKLLEQG